MDILTFRPADDCRNFGDELTSYLLQPRIPELDSMPGLFVGIGTHLDDRIPKVEPTIVFGAGAGYGPVPDLGHADVRFVRGPRTARYLGLPADNHGPNPRWITDPAILVADEVTASADPLNNVVFIPRWSVLAGDPSIPGRLCPLGIRTISPMRSPEDVIGRIAQSRYIITEALHGAVIADALRIPWTPVYSEQGHFTKWLDWCESMDVRYEPEDLHCVSVDWIRKHGKRHLSPEGTFIYRLRQVKAAVEELRSDLRKGKADGQTEAEFLFSRQFTAKR